MKKIVLLLVVIAFSCLTFAQQTKLKECLEAAVTNSSILNQAAIYQSYYDLESQKNKLNNYPVFILGSAVRYQSQVIDFELDTPFPGGINLPTMPHWQYQLTLDVNQRLYDWGTTKLLTQKAELQNELKQAELSVSIHELMAGISRVYMAIVHAQQQEKVQQIMLSSINAIIQEAALGVQNGMILEIDLLKFKNQALEIQQSIATVNGRKSGLIARLAILTNLDFEADVVFEIPNADENSNQIQRPENQVYGYTVDLLNKQSSLLKKSRMPQMGSFGQAGYGKPGLNYFSDSWNPYFVGGLKLSWDLWDYGKLEKNLIQVNLKSKLMQQQNQYFNLNLLSQLRELEQQVATIKTLIQNDHKMVNHSKEISRVSEHQFKNGTLSAAELIQQLNIEKNYRQNLELHQVQLVQTQIEIQSLTGNL